jgi:hypothetical protein
VKPKLQISNLTKWIYDFVTLILLFGSKLHRKKAYLAWFWVFVVVYLEIVGANVSAGEIICCLPMSGCVMKEIK